MLSKEQKICIIGMGLMGGSYAQALSEQGYKVYGISRSQSSIDYALNKGWIEEGKTEVNKEYIGQFDLIVFCLYPHVFLKWIEDYQDMIKPGAIITDVTGVKDHFVSQIQNILRPDLEFIPAHPMAGREAGGIEHADARVFNGANYIVTPTEKNTDEAIEKCKQLGYTLGFKNITILSTQKHDEMIAFLSQLTHCIAVSLMTSRDAKELADYSGDSFRDLTRIAKINDKMWSELFLLNKTKLLEQMELFEKSFLKLKDCIINDNVEKMREIMQDSTYQREHFE